MIKVLFVCVHNSARSQMAEAFLNRMGNGKFVAESAGLEPAPLNPLAVKVMEEIGYDISNNSTKSVFDLFKEGRRYHMIIKVCDQRNSQKCPVFPLTLSTLDWDLQDPNDFEGSLEEKIRRTRELRDVIKEQIEAFIREYVEI